MKKSVKMIIILIITIILCYAIFVTVDSIRLRNSKSGTKPLITISEEKTDNRVIYNGLGYSVKYYVDTNANIVNNMTLIEVSGYGAEFRLFNSILIWAWVE